jgi:hypothetical protein
MRYVRIAWPGSALKSMDPCHITATDNVPYPRGADALPHQRVSRSHSVVKSKIGPAHKPADLRQ